MAQTAEAVLAALATYRAFISQANRHAMEVMIPQIEAADIGDPDLFDSPEEKEETRLDFIRMLLGSDTKPSIQQPSDVLTQWDAIIRQVALDGATVGLDSARRDEKRESYRSAVLEGLSHLDVGCPTGQWALPPDFEVLMQEVDSLEGPGWYRYRQIDNLIFWEGWAARLGIHDTPERIRRRVEDGQSIYSKTQEVQENYDVAGGWVLGSGNESTCYAIYCRSKHGKWQNWSWRYVASLGQFGERIFDDLASVLDWYKNYEEPDERDFDITAAEVFEP